MGYEYSCACCACGGAWLPGAAAAAVEPMSVCCTKQASNGDHAADAAAKAKKEKELEKRRKRRQTKKDNTKVHLPFCSHP